MDKKFICTFNDDKQHLNDFVSNSHAVKLIKSSCIILLPLWCSVLFNQIYVQNTVLSVFCMFFIIFLISMLFVYPILLKWVLQKNSELRYGKGHIENRVIFDDKIYVEVKDDRIVLEYDKINKIVDCGSIYSLLYSKTSGTYFQKNSCDTASDEEIIAFLQDKTGAELTAKRTKREIIAFIIAIILSLILSAALVVLTLYVY